MEDEVTDKFGQVAFGSDMDLVRMQGAAASEKNTKYERELLRILIAWTYQHSNDKMDGFSGILYDKFPLLKKAAKVFPKLLLPETPNGTPVYRGVPTTSYEIRQQIRKSKATDWEPQNMGSSIIYMYKKPIKYISSRIVQSWTTDKQIAVDFMNKYPGRESLLLTSRQNDEFLFNQNLMAHLYRGRDESEILHFGKTYKEKIFISMRDIQWKKIFEEKK